MNEEIRISTVASCFPKCTHRYSCYTSCTTASLKACGPQVWWGSDSLFCNSYCINYSNVVQDSELFHPVRPNDARDFFPSSLSHTRIFSSPPAAAFRTLPKSDGFYRSRHVLLITFLVVRRAPLGLDCWLLVGWLVRLLAWLEYWPHGGC